MIKHDKYLVTREQIDKSDSPVGISGIVRVSNGERFLQKSIESFLPYVDEIIAVFHQSSDRTPEILRRLEKDNLGKVRVFEYEPHVYRMGSKEHSETPADSVHSFANFSNFALSKSRYRTVTKIDDDHVLVKKAANKIFKLIRENQGANGISYYSGVNVVKSEAGNFGVHNKYPWVGYGDHFFVDLTRETYFDMNPYFEEFVHPYKSGKFLGVLYYHLKYLKEDRGSSNYRNEGSFGVKGTAAKYKDVISSLQDDWGFLELSDFVSYQLKNVDIYPVSIIYERILKFFPLSLIRNMNWLLRQLPKFSGPAFQRSMTLPGWIDDLDLEEINKLL